MNKNLDFLLQKPIAHRGLHNNKCPENSLSAFLRAITNNYPIELDVQLTRDGKLVVFHDWIVDRMTEGRGKVKEKTCAELQKLYLNNTKEQIPILEDVLSLANKQILIVIEIKEKGVHVDKICTKVNKILQNYSGEFAISSFNPFVVKWFKNKSPEVARGQNFTDFANNNKLVAFIKKTVSYFWWIMSNNKPDFFAIRASMLPNSFAVKRVKKNNKPIFAYSITDKQNYDRIKSVIDNYFFDKEKWE